MLRKLCRRARAGSKNNFCIPKQILPNAARQSAAWTWQGEMASPKAKKAPPTVAKPKRPSPTTAAAKGGRAARAAARAQSRTRRPSLTTQGSSSSSAAMQVAAAGLDQRSLSITSFDSEFDVGRDARTRTCSFADEGQSSSSSMGVAAATEKATAAHRASQGRGASSGASSLNLGKARSRRPSLEGEAERRASARIFGTSPRRAPSAQPTDKATGKAKPPPKGRKGAVATREKPQVVDSDAVNKLTDMQIEEFREAFRVFDVDGSGSIEADELRKLMASVGQIPSDEELSEMIRIADADGSGEVDFYEFVALMAHKMADPANFTAVSEAFKIFDTDGSGYLDKSEIRRIMINAGEPVTWEDVNICLDDLDLNKDGLIDIDEFSALVLEEQDAMREIEAKRKAGAKKLLNGRKA